MKPFLLSNSFPFSLLRREVHIRPRTVEDLRQQLRTQPWKSAWGHSNTLPLASALAEADLTPATPRPVLSLSADNLPCLDGQTFEECWLLSPDYIEGFRPSIGEEVSLDKIRGWQVLQIVWILAPPKNKQG